MFSIFFPSFWSCFEASAKDWMSESWGGISGFIWGNIWGQRHFVRLFYRIFEVDKIANVKPWHLFPPTSLSSKVPKNFWRLCLSIPRVKSNIIAWHRNKNSPKQFPQNFHISRYCSADASLCRFAAALFFFMNNQIFYTFSFWLAQTRKIWVLPLKY